MVYGGRSWFSLGTVPSPSSLYGHTNICAICEQPYELTAKRKRSSLSFSEARQFKATLEVGYKTERMNDPLKLLVAPFL